jgi:hypothetical protein
MTIKHIIKNQKQTAEMLRNAGFVVRIVGTGMAVKLDNRRFSRMELLEFLDCECEDLKVTDSGVLIKWLHPNHRPR